MSQREALWGRLLTISAMARTYSDRLAPAVAATLALTIVGAGMATAQSRPLVKAEPDYGKYSAAPESVLANGYSSKDEVQQQVCSMEEISPELMAKLELRKDFDQILEYILENCPQTVGATITGSICEGSDCGSNPPSLPSQPSPSPTCQGNCPPPPTTTQGANPGNKKPVGNATENPTGADKMWTPSGATANGSTGTSTTSQERGPAQSQPANDISFKSKPSNADGGAASSSSSSGGGSSSSSSSSGGSSQGNSGNSHGRN